MNKNIEKNIKKGVFLREMRETVTDLLYSLDSAEHLFKIINKEEGEDKDKLLYIAREFLSGYVVDTLTHMKNTYNDLLEISFYEDFSKKSEEMSTMLDNYE